MIRYTFSPRAFLIPGIGIILFFVLACFATTSSASKNSLEVSYIDPDNAHLSNAWVGVSYTGPDSIHLSYSYSGGCDDCWATLQVIGNGNVITLKRFGKSSASGNYHHTDLAPGEYMYAIFRYTPDPVTDVPEVETLGMTSMYVVDGKKIWGTLLFDESYSGYLECPGSDVVNTATLTVPAGRTLDISGATIKAATYSCGIYVSGKLVLDESTHTEQITVYIFAPHSFSGIQQVTLKFLNGSEGSSIEHSKQIIVTINADAITMENVSQASITGLGDAAKNFSMSGADAVELSGRFHNATLVNSKALTLTRTDTGNLTGARIAGNWQLNNIEDLRIEGMTTMEDSAVLDVSNSNLTDSYIYLTGKGNAIFAHNTFSGYVVLYTMVETDFTDSFFRDGLTLTSPSKKLTFTDNKFAGGAELRARNAAVFQNNLFLYPLVLEDILGISNPEKSWCQDNGLAPLIEGNSFVGQTALDNWVDDCSIDQITPISIGTNYYGDRQVQFTDGIFWWLDRGGIVDRHLFKFEQSAKTGKQWQDNRIFPSFWVNGWRFGQYTFYSSPPESLLRNTESLFMLDLVTSHERVNDAEIWAEWNGTRVNPTRGPKPTLMRDQGARSTTGAVHRTARSTVNFILPPANGESANLVIWFDTRGISGYDDPQKSGELKKLIELEDIPLRDASGPIGFHIVPVTVNGETPSISDVLATIRTVTPAMLPITSDQLWISATSWSPEYTINYLPLGIFTNMVTTKLALYRYANQYDPQDLPNGELMDFVIGVLPKNTLGGAEGVYMNLRRSVILVDESKPEAIFHEMGHAIGLYNVREQYSWPHYPPNGRPVEGFTLFLNKAYISNEKISGFFQGDAGRIIHTPATHQWWHDENLVVVDVMGNKNPFWPNLDTLKKFADAFAEYAQLPRPSSQNAHLAQTTSDSEKRVVVMMETERFETIEKGFTIGYTGERRCASYQPIAETIRVVPRTLTNANPSRTAPTLTSGGQGSLPICLDKDQNHNGAGDVRFCLLPLDENGYMFDGYNECKRVLPPDEINTARSHDIAILTFDVPISAARFSLITSNSNNPTPTPPPLLRASTALTVELLAPAPGTTLTETVTLRWDSQVSHADPSQPSDQPLLYQVAYSDDNGASWTPVGLPVEGNTLTLHSNSLPQDRPISFRVTATDAFTSTHSQVDDLVVPSDPPVVKIFNPQTDDQSTPDHGWILRAAAWEASDGTPLSGTWHSSLDGDLGTEPMLQNVVLSLGTHKLSYNVTAANGSTGSASVSVTVADMSSVDLALKADDFILSIPGRDPVLTDAQLLTIGLTQTAVLQVRNTGTPLTATLQLFVDPPDGAEQQLAEQTISLAPFETAQIGSPYIAAQSGSYRFRGQVEVQNVSDQEPANNQRTWEIKASTPPRLALSTTAMTLTGPVGVRTIQSIILSNSGEQKLIVQHIQKLGGVGISYFELASDECTGQVLAAGEQCRITIQYVPQAGVEEQTTFEITTTDPEQPAHQISLTGRVGPSMYQPLYLPLVQKPTQGSLQ